MIAITTSDALDTAVTLYYAIIFILMRGALIYCYMS